MRANNSFIDHLVMVTGIIETISVNIVSDCQNSLYKIFLVRKDTLEDVGGNNDSQSHQRVRTFFKVATVSLIVLIGLPKVCQAEQIDFERLATAIYKAEGGRKASKPYGVMYKGCDWKHPAYCRQVCLNTLKNTFKRHSASNSQLSYGEFLRNRYAPLSHHPSNQFWLNNVRRIYGRNI